MWLVTVVHRNARERPENGLEQQTALLPSDTLAAPLAEAAKDTPSRLNMMLGQGNCSEAGDAPVFPPHPGN